MTERIVKKANERWYRVTELKELFFYTLYKFNAYWAVGEIGKKAANRVEDQLGINLHGFKVELNSKYLKHFLYSHFNEKRREQRNIHVDDIERMKDVIDNFSFVEGGNVANRLLFSRKTPNGTFELVVEIDHKKKILSGVSFRIKT